MQLSSISVRCHYAGLLNRFILAGSQRRRGPATYADLGTVATGSDIGSRSKARKKLA
jgi:hypothetical protein